MADIVRTGSATWNGDLKTGNGTISTGGGGLRELNYSFRSRFEDGAGANPEELIASAHASCFSMALSMILGNEGHPPEKINTKASVTMVKTEAGFKVTKIHLETEGRVAGMDEATFRKAADKAKENCPISVLLKPGLDAITLDARLAR